jgi:hypothetical protein
METTKIIESMDGVDAYPSEFSSASGNRKKRKRKSKINFRELASKLSKVYPPAIAYRVAKKLMSQQKNKTSNFGGEPRVTKYAAVLADTPITDRLDVDNFYPAEGNKPMNPKLKKGLIIGGAVVGLSVLGMIIYKLIKK